MMPIKNLSSAWRLLSMQLAAAAVVFGSLPPDTQSTILGLVNVPVERVPAVLGLLFMLTRLVKQPALPDNAQERPQTPDSQPQPPKEIP